MSLMLKCHCGNFYTLTAKCNQCGIVVSNECFKCHNGSFIHIQNRNSKRYSIPKGSMMFACGCAMIWTSLFMVGTMLGVLVKL